ncbi:hypothetical protein BGZ49_004922, partial [Haplosporangium sp. Z 27]
PYGSKQRLLAQTLEVLTAGLETIRSTLGDVVLTRERGEVLLGEDDRLTTSELEFNTMGGLNDEHELQ